MSTNTDVETVSAPPPGWYVDTNGHTRWWDGTAWTDIFQPTAEGTPPSAPKPVNHILHAVLTIFTGGLWAVVWIALVLRNRGI